MPVHYLSSHFFPGHSGRAGAGSAVMVEHGVIVVLTLLVFSTLFVAVIENELSVCRLCVTTSEKLWNRICVCINTGFDLCVCEREKREIRGARLGGGGGLGGEIVHAYVCVCVCMCVIIAWVL